METHIITNGRRHIKTISVWLDFYEDNDTHMYYCPGCRCPIMQYKGEVIMEIPGLHPNKMPIIIQCSNFNCKRKYNFISFAF